MSRPKWRTISLKQRESKPVRIISEGAITSKGFADGKLIPILIVDTNDRPDIQELVRVHEHLPPGDATSQWCKLEGTSDAVALVLTFTRPTEVVIILNFDLELHGGTVDLILASRACFLQPGKDGDRPSTTFGNGKILVEVPETGFSEHWQEIRYCFLVEHFRGRGLTKQQAKLAAGGVIEEFRKFIDSRLS